MSKLNPELPDPDGLDSEALNESGKLEIEVDDVEVQEVMMHKSIVRSSKFYSVIKSAQSVNQAFQNFTEGHHDETKAQLVRRGVAGALIGNVIGLAVGSVVLALVYMLDSNAEDHTIHLIALFAIPVIWNIAQYASYSIQLTGHFWPWQHLNAILSVGGPILGANLIGVGFALLWAFGLGAPLWCEFIVILLPLVLGLVGKTWSKLNFIRERDMEKDGREKCPFTTIDSGVFWTEFRAPFVCMIWTMLFAVGLQSFVHIVGEDNDLYPVWLIFCYILTLGLLYFGLYMLKKHVVRCAETPSFTYNLHIVLVFYYVYGLMVSGQIRLIIINFSGGMRMALGIFHPIQNLLRRHILMRQYKTLLKQARYSRRLSSRSKSQAKQDEDEAMPQNDYRRQKTDGATLSEGVVLLLQKEGKTAAFAIVVAITASSVGMTILTDMVPLYVIDFVETVCSS